MLYKINFFSMISLRFPILLFFIILLSNFQIQAQGDDCESSVKLNNVVKYCSNPAQYTNVGATASIWPVATCWPANATADAWFWFTAVATDIQISVSGEPGKGTIKQPNIELKEGNCGFLSTAGCSAQNATNVTSLYKGGLTPGNTYLIRISTTNANRGTFTLCVSNYTPTVNPGADCDGAVRLCDKSQVFVPGLSGGGKNNHEIEASSCFNYNAASLLESNSSWYWWTCETAGTLLFDITPIDPKNDLDFILYQLDSANACGKRTIIRCTATGCPVKNGIVGLDMTSTDINEPTTDRNDPAACNSASINGYLKYVDMVAGKSYALMINNFDAASGFTINFGGSGTIKGPKAVITASTASSLCKGESATFDGSQSKNYDALNWIFTSGNPATATTVGPHKIDYTIPGTYTTYLKASDKTCASGNSTDSIKVTINAPPVLNAGAAIVSSTDCDKPTGSVTGITVTGKPAYKYEWFTPPATSVFTSTTTPDLNAMPPGQYFLVVTDGTTCKDTAGLYEIKNYDTPVTPGVKDNIAYCEGTPLGPITATGNGGTYIWFANENLTDTLHVGPVYTPVNTTTDTLYLVETAHGCTSIVNKVIVVIIPLPVISGVSNNKPYCEGETILPITVNGNGGTYTWYDDGKLTNVLHVGPTYTPLNTTTDTLYVTESAKGCSSAIDTVIVVVNPLPTADAGVITHIVCSSPTIQLNGSASGGSSLIYDWAPGKGIVSGGNTLKPVVNAEGTYTLTVKNEITGCTKTSEVKVIKDPVPAASFTPNVYTGEDPLNVVFNNTSTGSNIYTWLLDDKNKSTDKNPSYTYLKPGEYKVLLITSDSGKCPDTANVRIIVYEKFTVELPNIFTPNGDGHNDVFSINTTGILGITGEIYDRWGLQMFTWDQQNAGWDGRSPAGSMAPAGIYFYILRIRPLDGREPVIKAGELMLAR